MKLIGLLKYIENGTIEKFFDLNYSNLEYDFIDIYMNKEISIHSELLFIDNEIENAGLIINRKGEKYINLFPLHLLIELFDDFKRLYSPLKNIESRLIQYRINDA